MSKDETTNDRKLYANENDDNMLIVLIMALMILRFFRSLFLTCMDPVLSYCHHV